MTERSVAQGTEQARAAAAAPSQVHELVRQAQEGDRAARERLLETYRPFVMRAAASVAGRFVRVGQDDEASVAMMAFDEAISAYKRQGGSSFFSFAEMVIRRRLIDHFRHESSSQRLEVPLSGLVCETEDGELDDPLLQVEAREAQRQFEEAILAQERREEIGRLSGMLHGMGIRFQDLVEQSPHHRDARERALQVALSIVQRPDLAEQVRQRGNLPLKDLEGLVGVSRKTLERQRKYIIALVLILSGDFPHLKEYLRH
ncbi:RNA polymerase sigma-I factor [Carboxydochorda subterranea]|uniref:RNA polymerase sigma factor SigI n=1 Tax=Carboxydichorda subterranea TaxID=3109565 RepID=A0ABZ1BZS7_9FIRM|nr:RNA polymerase sigma-I factor [Limnochorda sp. L945t]WRP18287.1 RNA polymerase sigma-I factor [Limnochorda sp. L945t]